MAAKSSEKLIDEMGSNVKRPAKVRIYLEDSPNVPPGGQFFGVNGKSFLLQSGVEAEVPRGIIDVLDNAIEEVPIVDTNSMQIRRYAKRLRFPYRNLGPVVET